MNDGDLVAAITKLRGEWQELGGGELVVAEVSLEQSLAEQETDLLVFPSRYLGEFSEAGRLRPMRTSILESKELDFGDILPLVREREIVYGQQVMALPLGCPTPLVASTDAEPKTVIEPLAEEYAAFVLLARAAPLARHASREALWFDPDTMQPRLAEPPFIRALKELVDAKSGVHSPCVIGEELLQDRISSAVVWPCRASEASGLASLTVHPIPPATQVYNSAAQTWEKTPPRQVTLLASSGRLVGVTTGSRNAASAFRLAGWLASPGVAGQLVASSDGLAICRGSQRRMADNWLGSSRSSAGQQFSEQLAAALRQREGVTIPRLRGVDQYLEKLAAAVRSAVEGHTTPEEALATAVEDWEKLTNALGRDRQRLAYRRCLGIEP